MWLVHMRKEAYICAHIFLTDKSQQWIWEQSWCAGVKSMARFLYSQISLYVLAAADYNNLQRTWKSICFLSQTLEMNIYKPTLYIHGNLRRNYTVRRRRNGTYSTKYMGWHISAWTDMVIFYQNQWTRNSDLSIFDMISCTGLLIFCFVLSF